MVPGQRVRLYVGCGLAVLIHDVHVSAAHDMHVSPACSGRACAVMHPLEEKQTTKGGKRHETEGM